MSHGRHVTLDSTEGTIRATVWPMRNNHGEIYHATVEVHARPTSWTRIDAESQVRSAVLDGRIQL